MIDTISKRAYFLNALRAGAGYHKAWVLEVFSFVEKLSATLSNGKLYFPFALMRDERGDYFTHYPNKPGKIYIEDAIPGQPLLTFREDLELTIGDLPNVTEPVLTCYGNALINQCALIYAFGDKVPFMAGPLTVKAIEKKIEGRLKDTPTAGEPRDPEFLYVDEFKRFHEGVRYLEGFSSICVPTATRKTITVSKDVIKRRDQLLREHTTEELQDPLVLAKIEKELIEMEKAWFKGDPAERFFIKSKSWDVVRKKMFLMQGQEAGFGRVGKTITRSLNDGWDIDNLPDMANAQRSGSYSRGFLTALGGVETKTNYRMFQNTVVVPGDCGTKLGLRITPTKDIMKYFIHSYHIGDDGKPVEITEENADSLVGKAIVLRSPGYCKASRQNFCSICVGSAIAKTPTAIPSYAASVGSIYQGLMMKAMHGRALKTNRIDYLAELS